MKVSAGLLLYRIRNELEVFLVHPGGPFWKNKQAGAWTIPKGEIASDEAPLKRAKIEFQEETGQPVDGNFIPLASIRQKGGKTVHVWAIEGDIDPTQLISNTFELEWPPRSGKIQYVPEIDQGAWFKPEQAKELVNPAQVALIQELENMLQK